MKLGISLFFLFAFLIGAVANVEHSILEQHGSDPEIKSYHDLSEAADLSKRHHRIGCHHCHFGQCLLPDFLISLERPAQKIVSSAYLESAFVL